MSRVSTTRRCTPAEAAALQGPRDFFLVRESDDGDGSFSCAEGPFDHYTRTVSVTPIDGDTGDALEVTEQIDFRVAAPLWRVLLTVPIKRSLRQPPDGLPWWAPPDRFDRRTARTISVLCIGMIITGYLGALIGQTATFASDEFGTSDRAQGFLFAAVRLGTLLTVVITAMADRRGRRHMLLIALGLGCSLTMFGALATGLWTLGASQAVARGMATAISVLIGIMAAEAAPRSSRAYVTSVLVLTAALGAGMVVWILPLADLSISAWRILYLVPAIGLPVTWWLARNLEESDRFEQQAAVESPSQAAMLASRLALIAATGFLIGMFAAPASQFRNDFLRDERGFSAAQVSLFVVITNTPVGIGVAIAGKLADRRGRRPVGAFAVFGGTALTIATYAVDGWGMWTASVLAGIVGSMAAPALGVYGAEMFGTSRRGRANGIVSLVALAGSATGLLLVGELSDRFDSFAAAFLVVAAAPLIVVVLVLTRYPETAHRELEDLNPGDRPPVIGQETT